MSGNLLNIARRDSKKYITKGGFEESITLTSPLDVVFNTTGLVSKHWIGFDTDGSPVNSKNAHICISESELTDNNYIVRNANKEIDLKGHRVSVTDSSGDLKEYVIKEWFPSETLGLIVCILGDYELN